VSELALDDVERYALVRHLERVGVPELMRHKAPADTRPRRSPLEVCPGGRRRPRPTARPAADDTKEARRQASFGAPAATARAVRSPSRPCRPRAGGRPCRGARAPSRAVRRDQARSDRALNGRAIRRARARRSSRVRSPYRPSPQDRMTAKISPRCAVGRPDNAGPCCAAGGRGDNRVRRRATGADPANSAAMR
jgi:hypothetical protein